MNRTNRGANRPFDKMKFRGISRAKSPDSPPVRVKSHEVYPVRVKSHDGYVECNSCILADLSDVVLGEQSLPLRLKFEIGGNWFGKDLALKYGSSRGAEVNGVLVGQQEASRVLILAFRQMDAGLASGASSLSEEWQSAFAGLMARIRWDPKLSGLQPVGWFRAHPKASLSLSRRDIAVFKQFFPESWQVGMVLQPEKASTKGRFFLREPGQPIDSAAGAQDFVVQRDSERSRVIVQPASQPAAVSEPQNADSRWRLPKIPAWLSRALLVSALGGLFWWSFRPSEPPTVASHRDPAAMGDSSQEASNQAAALWKKWQDEAIAEQKAAPPMPADVSPPPEKEDNASLPPKEDMAPLLPKPEPDTRQAKQESLGKISKERPNPASKSSSSASERSARPPQPLQTVSQTLPPVVRKSDTAVVPSPLPAPPSAAPVDRSAPPSGQTPAAWLSAANLPHVFNETPSPQAPASPLNLQTTAPTVLGPEQPAPSPTPPPTRPASSQTLATPAKLLISSATSVVPASPTSGRLIWTGRLRKNETVVIDGGTATIGSAIGSLPGKPVRINVSTGNLTKDGIVVYTKHPRGLGKSSEPAGPQNGWNKTVYEWDPGRAADVELVEAPGPNNGWKRLALRAKDPRDSMILVEWTAQP